MNPHLLSLAHQLESELREGYQALMQSNPATAKVLVDLSIEAQRIADTLQGLPAPAEPQYRMLEAGEILRDGDEVLNDAWTQTRFPGTAVGNTFVGYFRRRIIPASEFQPLVDFHERTCGENTLIHGTNCPKVPHVGTGHLHAEDDDKPFDVDGVLYCGRCHHCLPDFHERVAKDTQRVEPLIAGIIQEHVKP